MDVFITPVTALASGPQPALGPLGLQANSSIANSPHWPSLASFEVRRVFVRSTGCATPSRKSEYRHTHRDLFMLQLDMPIPRVLSSRHDEA
ncbi:hypothetical protein EVAR_60865_1 [Eumeta japonica]|uniref:Uncharacterized protein n=1 Tax=Eumeta variegata TaxID=151549 RepID=A0A4C1Y9K9_EUMVA|nr:hypothetical protein EVAR_60865_1 [Eumeta japonica]